MVLHPSISRIISYPKIAQRTPEWYSYRKKRVTASEASTIIARGKGYRRIFEEKVGIRESNFTSEYMTIGTNNEEVVVDMYRKLYPGEEVFHDLSIIPHKEHDYVLNKTHLVQHYIRMQGQPIRVHEIDRDPTWFAKNSDIFKKFVREVREYFPFDLEDFNEQIVRRVLVIFPFDLEDFNSQT